MLPQTFHPYLLANQSKAIPRVMYMDVHHVQLLSPYSQVSDSQHPHPLNMSSKLPSMEFCLHSLRAERKAFRSRRGIRKQEMQQQLKFEGKKVFLHLLLLQNPHRTCFDSFLRGTGPCLLDLFPIPEKLAIELLYFLINCITSLIYLHTHTYIDTYIQSSLYIHPHPTNHWILNQNRFHRFTKKSISELNIEPKELMFEMYQGIKTKTMVKSLPFVSPPPP